MARVQVEGVGWLAQALQSPATDISTAHIDDFAVSPPGLHLRPVRRSQPPCRLSHCLISTAGRLWPPRWLRPVLWLSPLPPLWSPFSFLSGAQLLLLRAAQDV